MAQTILIALAVVNIFAFVYVGLEKRKRVVGSERFSEVSFFFIAVFFTSLGVLLGMFAFRHKTRKFYFVLGMVLLFLEQTALIFYFLKTNPLI